MIDGEARIKAGITCACSRCDTSASLQRRVCRCILTSGRRAPSFHPARCSWCHRRTVQTVAVKKKLDFPLFLILLQDKRALPGPLPHCTSQKSASILSSHRRRRRSHLLLLLLGRLEISGAMTWSGYSRSHPFVSIVGGKMCFRDPAVVTSPAASSQPPSRVEPVCARGRAMIHSACVLKTGDVTKLLPLSWTNPD